MLKYKTGDRFGRLTIVALAPREPRFHKCRAFLCRCDCGREITVTTARLKREQTRSCGCLRADLTIARNSKHGAAIRGMIAHEYRSWLEAKRRCYNPMSNSFARYGGVGITMCYQWRASFAAFVADMGPCPQGLTLDRIDGSKGYEPGNCRWADRFTQSNNRPSFNRSITFEGRTMNQNEWERELGLPPGVLRKRLWRGWSVERAFKTPCP